MHKHGVMHRDLKPQNLLVDDSDAHNPLLKVCGGGPGLAPCCCWGGGGGSRGASTAPRSSCPFTHAPLAPPHPPALTGGRPGAGPPLFNPHQVLHPRGALPLVCAWVDVGVGGWCRRVGGCGALARPLGGGGGGGGVGRAGGAACPPPRPPPPTHTRAHAPDRDAVVPRPRGAAGRHPLRPGGRYLECGMHLCRAGPQGEACVCVRACVRVCVCV